MQHNNHNKATASLLVAGLLAASAATAQTLPTGATHIETDISSEGLHALSGDGQRLVFVSDRDITGANADGNKELFLWDRQTGVTQLTNIVNSELFSSSRFYEVDINADGSVIAVLARGDLTNQGASERELYRWVEATGWQRLTITAGGWRLGTSGIGIDASGDRIMFTSKDDYTDENPDEEYQVFLWKAGEGITQITTATNCGGSEHNWGTDLSGNGRRLLFQSTCQWGTANPNKVDNLFLWDETTGVTALTNFSTAVWAQASLNADGSKAALGSQFDLAGDGSRGDIQLYQWTDGAGFTALSSDPITGDTPVIDAAGNRIAYVAANSQGLSGVNPENKTEIFLWTALGPVSVTDSAYDSAEGTGNNAYPDLSDDARHFSLIAYEAFDAPGNNQTGYFLLDSPTIYLESPTPASSESGIGLIRGWACEAEKIEVLIDGSIRLELPYGTVRPDTELLCGDQNNGFGGVFNWSFLGDGAHEIRTFKDSVQISSATFTVTTLGSEYLTGVFGAYQVTDFPTAGTNVNLHWSQPHQNFVFVSDSISLADPDDVPGDYTTTLMESPFSGSTESGIGLIRGWACQASKITVKIDDNTPMEASYGAKRPDTQGVCGDEDNGFGVVLNWNDYTTGAHRLRAYRDDAATPFADLHFNVMNMGWNYLSGIGSPGVTLENFPQSGSSTEVSWSERHQGVVITNYTP